MEQLQRTAYSAERFAQITIKTPLQFSRTLQTAPVASQVQFNSIKNLPPFIGKKKRNEYSNKFIETPRDNRGQAEDQQDEEAENGQYNLEEEFIFQGLEGQGGLLPQGPNGPGGLLPQGPDGQGGAGSQGYASLSPEPQPGSIRGQKNTTPRQFLQNVSNLIQPLGGLNLAGQEAECRVLRVIRQCRGDC